MRFYIALCMGAGLVGVRPHVRHCRRRFWRPATSSTLSYLGLCRWLMLADRRPGPQATRRSEDEGIIVVVITLATMVFFCHGRVRGAGQEARLEIVPLVLAGRRAAGLVRATYRMAFHYADLHYFDDPATPEDDEGDLGFPGRGEPCAWDFLYFSFVVGMTARFPMCR